MNDKELERILKALANRRRLLILKHLKNKRKISVGDIAHTIGLSFKATSKHLAVLYNVNLVDREQISTHMFYYITPDLEQLPRHILTLL